MRDISMKSIRSTLASATRFSVAMLSFCAASAAFAAGFDGLSLTTNDWFDANFTALTADTAIAADSTTGITLGAGSWTAVPATGTATIVEDEDDDSATVLSIEAPEEELEFTPAAFQSPTGLETVTFRVKADAIDTFPTPGDAQTAFTLYSADGETFALIGYVSDGTSGVWTNLTAAGVTAGDLANAWFDLTMDFCGENSARLVRFSVDGTVLADSEGATWFPVVKSNATTINSLSFAGVGSLKSFSGDSLAEIAVASYNGTGYPTVAAAIAAGEADSWTNGVVTLLADAEWTPAASGTYSIDVDGHQLTINNATYTAEGSTYTVTRRFYWIGGNTSNTQKTLDKSENWSVSQGGSAGTEVPSVGDLAIFATASQAKIAGGSTFPANILIAADTTLHTQSQSLTGTLTGDITIDSGVVATLLANNNTSTKLASKGAVLGAGTLRCETSNNGWIEIYGSFTNFEGKVVLSSQTSFQPSPAIWPIEASDISLDASAKTGNYCQFRTASALYRLGAYNGPVITAEECGKRAGLEIGARNEDSSVWGTWYINNDRRNYVNGLYWVAPDAVLTYAITNAYEITVSKGGTVAIPDVHCITNVAFATSKNDSDYHVHSTTHTGCQLYFDDIGGYFVYTGEEAHDNAIASRIASIAETAFAGFDNDEDVELDLSAKSAVFAGRSVNKKGEGALTISGVASHGDIGVTNGTFATSAATLGAVTLESGTGIRVPVGATIASLDAKTDAKVKVDITSLEISDSEQTVLTVSDGADLTDVLTVETNDVGFVYAFSGFQTGAVKVTVSRAPQSFVWTGATGDGLWATPGNWAVEGETATVVPGAGDTVSITTEEESLAVVVADGQNVGNLTKGDNVALVGPGPYEVAVTEGVVALTRVPSTFVWTNSGTSNWETLSNWKVNGRATDVTPGSEDEVRFPASLGGTPYVKYSDSQTISNAVIDATVTLQIVGTRHDKYINAKEIAGDGKLIMTNSAIGATGRADGSTIYSTNLVVNVDIEFAAASTNRLYCYYGNVVVNGDVTGSGCVEGYAYKQSFGPEFAGNNENFCGEYWGTVSTTQRRDFTKFHPSGTSSNAVWTVKGSEGNSPFFADNGATYYFGALNGTVDNSNKTGSGYVSECWAEVGALNIDCGFDGYYARMTRRDSATYYVNHIRKVGTAKLTLSLGGMGCGHVEIAGGVVDFATTNSVPGEIETRKYELRFIGEGATMAISATTTDESENTVFCDPSARIANSTYPISFSNTVNEVHAWATALAASNVGGLVKKGEGTLVLGAAPQYSGDTYLDGGTLKIPAAAGVKVKTHVKGMAVVKAAETVDGVEYTVYTLGRKTGSMVFIF